MVRFFGSTKKRETPKPRGRPHFDSSWFGGVKVNGKSYGDVLVVGEEIEARDDPRLDQELGTDHLIGNWEVEKLLSNHPEVVVIGSGTAGDLRVTEEIREKFKKAGVELRVLATPQAIEEFNRLYSQGKKVNILVHTTC